MKQNRVDENKATKLLLIEKKQTGESGFFQDLTRKSFPVHLVANGTAGIRDLEKADPDLVIINAASLRTNGQRIVSRFHNLKPDLPVILIANPADDEELANGANIVLTLPFTVQKLVNAIRMYQKTPAKNILTCGPIELNLQTQMVYCHGKETRLTPRLVHLLRIFLKKPNYLHLREDLFKEVWQTDYTEDTRTLDVHISWLREAIETDPRAPEILVTVRGRGYKCLL